MGNGNGEQWHSQPHPHKLYAGWAHKVCTRPPLRNNWKCVQVSRHIYRWWVTGVVCTVSRDHHQDRWESTGVEGYPWCKVFQSPRCAEASWFFNCESSQVRWERGLLLAIGEHHHPCELWIPLLQAHLLSPTTYDTHIRGQIGEHADNVQQIHFTLSTPYLPPFQQPPVIPLNHQPSTSVSTSVSLPEPRKCKQSHCTVEGCDGTGHRNKDRWRATQQRQDDLESIHPSHKFTKLITMYAALCYSRGADIYLKCTTFHPMNIAWPSLAYCHNYTAWHFHGGLMI